MEDNPSRTLAIEITESAPSAEGPSTRYGGRYYTVADTAWDRIAFSGRHHMWRPVVGRAYRC
jgi:hypothetical protein